VSRFRLIEAEKAGHSVVRMCRLLGVSPSGYYAWRKRPPSARARADAALTTTIRAIHANSRGTYGAPRVHAELGDAHGVRCGRKRVARLMRTDGLTGVCRRRSVRTTCRDTAAPVSDDLVKRAFTAPAPDRLWLADITYLPTWQGFLYLAVVLDAAPAASSAGRWPTTCAPSWSSMPSTWRSGTAARPPAWSIIRITAPSTPA
jgi:putative transposase